jgi:hypothetical protein
MAIKKNDLKKIYCYDIETYPNLFAIGFKELDTGIRKTFTIWSNPDNREEFINEIEELTNFLLYNVKRVIGYNNFAF